MNYTYIYTYSPVLDQTVQSGPTISGTGPDCGPKEPDHTVRSCLQSPFSSEKKTGLNGPVSLKPDLAQILYSTRGTCNVSRITSKPHSDSGLLNWESGLKIQLVAHATGQGGCRKLLQGTSVLLSQSYLIQLPLVVYLLLLI